MSTSASSSFHLLSDFWPWICLVAVIGASIVRFLTTRTPKGIANLPTLPAAHWLWGHEMVAFETPSAEQYKQWFESYGSVVRMKGALGHKDVLAIGDPAALSHLYKNIFNYPHGPLFHSLLERIVGKGVGTIEDEQEHTHMRSVLNPAFSPKILRRMGPQIFDCAHKLVHILSDRISETNEKGVIEINILDYTSRTTLDIIGRIGFRHDFFDSDGTSTLEAERILKSCRQQANIQVTRGGYIGLLVLRLFPFIAKLPIPVIDAQGEVRRIIWEIGRRLLKESKGDELDNEVDILSLIVSANRKLEKKWSVEDMLDHITTFVFGGHETSSYVLGIILWELGRRRQLQTELRQEIRAFPSDSGDPTLDDFATKFPLLDAIVREGLRMYPAGPHTEREVAKEDIIPLRHPIRGLDGSLITEIRVEPGQVINIPIMAVNHSKIAWSPSGDPDDFIPSRWLGDGKNLPQSNDLVTQGGWSKMSTFAEGPRMCIGMRLAIFELKALLFVLVKELEFEHVPGVELEMTATSLLEARVIGREEEGVCVPLRVKVVEG